MNTITYTGTLIVTSCWCGIQLGVPDSLYRKAQSDKTFAIHCPVGHEFVYRQNSTDRERARADQAEADARFWREQNRTSELNLEFQRRSNIALKGHLTRYRKRVALGVCPVAGCHRHFPNVQSHVQTVHGDWLADHPEVFSEA